MTRRFESQFDPEELSRITHRGLKPLSGSGQPRLSQEEVTTLRGAALEEEKPAVKAHRLWNHLFGGIASAFKALFAPKAKKVTQCDNYGHVLRPGWKGEFPKCLDCDAIITATDQIRGATPKQKNSWGEEQTQSGRRYVK